MKKLQLFNPMEVNLYDFTVSLSNHLPEMTLANGIAVLEILSQMKSVSALGTAQILWAMRQDWPKLSDKAFETPFEQEADFIEHIYHSLGYHPDTIRRYCLAWQFLHEIKAYIPNDLWKQFLERDIKDLIALGQSVNEHGTFSRRALERLSLEPDTSSLRRAIRREREMAPASEHFQFRLQADGTLEIWQDGKGEMFGYLNPPESDLLKRGRAWLLRRGSIQEIGPYDD